MEVISLALQWGGDPIIVETDNVSVVRMVSSVKKDSSELGHLISEIKGMLQSGRQISVIKITRSQIKASHALARFGRTSDRTAVWFASGSDVILNFILRECILMFK
jgi:hypothetical protein